MKLVVLMLAAALTYMVGYVAYYGRQTRLTGDALMLAHHRGGTNCAMLIALIVVTAIETLLYQRLAGRSPLLWAHLPLAVTFAGLFLLMRFRFDGLRSKAHRYLAYACLAAYAGALTTGGMLLWRI